jgi:hypothetical protein
MPGLIVLDDLDPVNHLMETAFSSGLLRMQEKGKKNDTEVF